MNRLFPALVGATLLLSACGSGSTPSATPTSSRDLLSFSSASLGTAYVGETYSGTVAPLGGTGPYSVRLVSGTLPGGLKFSGGGSASITGTPTTTGSATFTLEVSDANLSVKSQSFNLSVAELPPLDFVPKLPGGELRGETRIPLNVQGPRGVRAARFTWVLPDNAQVTGVQSLGGTDAGRPIRVLEAERAYPGARFRLSPDAEKRFSGRHDQSQAVEQPAAHAGRSRFRLDQFRTGPGRRG